MNINGERGRRSKVDQMMDERIVSLSPEETMEIGERLAGELLGGEVIALDGPLGSGKTTLVKGIAKGLGVADTSDVRSPTFVLLRTYDGRTSADRSISLHHMDAYRLSGKVDFDSLGGLDLLTDDAVLVVEWADRISSGLPGKQINISLEHDTPETRIITIKKQGTS